MKVLSRAAPVQYLVWKLCVVLSLCLEFVNRKRREIQDFAGILLMAGNNSLALGCPVDTPSWRYSSPLPRW